MHGVHFVLTFKWGSDQIPEPEAVVVLYKREDSDCLFVADILRRSWLSFDDAVADGKEVADKFAARHGQEGLAKKSADIL
jgi:hypothetical protein